LKGATIFVSLKRIRKDRQGGISECKSRCGVFDDISVTVKASKGEAGRKGESATAGEWEGAVKGGGANGRVRRGSINGNYQHPPITLVSGQKHIVREQIGSF